MKRVGHVMEREVQTDNLHEAFLRAVRGKANNQEAQLFRLNLDDELARMADELIGGRYRFGAYHKFTVYDPKKRTICAAPFRDRVAMHAMMRICHPVFDDYQVYDSYASRIGKGTYKALERVRQLIRKDGWFAKLDVCRFFSSIDHSVMLEQLNRLFKDHLLLSYFEQLICGYEVSKGRGLPIGNLTSQYFANHYLAVADRYLKEQLHAPHAIRYMDDTLLLDTDKESMMNMVEAYMCFVKTHLRMDMHQPVINKCCSGVPFLGYVVFPRGMHLVLRSRRRFRNRLATLAEEYRDGRLTDDEYHNRLTSMYAFVEYAQTMSFKKRVAHEQGFLP